MKQYNCLLSETPNTNEGKRVTNNPNVANKKRKERKKFKREEQKHETFEANKKHIKKLSNIELTSDQVNLVAKGLKFIPTPVTNDNQIRRQLFQDFNDFARRMRVQYIFHGKTKNLILSTLSLTGNHRYNHRLLWRVILKGLNFN